MIYTDLNELNYNDLFSLVWITVVLFILLYTYYKIVSTVHYFKDLSSKKSLSFFNSDLPPLFPNGWIPVAYSSSIKNDNKIHESILCGNDIILFRDENLKVTCLDAYCSHLGASLAYGSNLVKFNGQNCVRCPFHGWSFNRNGDCVDIPYNCSKEMPKGTSIKSYHVKEMNGFVYVWYHADDEQPYWSLENIDQISVKKWVFMGDTEHIVSCHFQEIPENGADTSHLNAIHQGSVINGSDVSSHRWLNNLINKVNYHQWYAEYDLDNNGSTNDSLNNNELTNDSLNNNESINKESKNKEPHTCRIFLRKKTIFLTFNVFEMNIQIKQIGPCIVHLIFKASLFGYELNGVFVQSVQPIEPFKHKICHLFYSSGGFFNQILSKLFIYGEAKMIERDIYIWNRKKFLKRPFLLKTEKSISKYRKWFLQFYSANSLTVETLRNKMDW